MDLEDQVIEQFQHCMDLKYQCMETLPSLIAEASELLVHCLLNDRKVLICGNGGSASNAFHFTSCLINRYDRERPSLPAICLAADNATTSAIATMYSHNDVFSKQIRAFGKPGDTLIVITTSGTASNLVQAIRAAHDRDMSVVALTGGDGGGVASLLHPEDIELRVPSASRPRVLEAHLMLIFSLCHLIDQQLFGSIE